MSFLEAHWDEIILILFAVNQVLTMVVALTETKKDDEFVAKLWTFLRVLAPYAQIAKNRGSKVV